MAGVLHVVYTSIKRNVPGKCEYSLYNKKCNQINCKWRAIAWQDGLCVGNLQCLIEDIRHRDNECEKDRDHTQDIPV